MKFYSELFCFFICEANTVMRTPMNAEVLRHNDFQTEGVGHSHGWQDGVLDLFRTIHLCHLFLVKPK